MQKSKCNRLSEENAKIVGKGEIITVPSGTTATVIPTASSISPASQVFLSRDSKLFKQWKAICENRIVNIEESILKFQDDDIKWDKYTPFLLVRESYHEIVKKILKMLETSSGASWLILGSWGIGKSLFGLWFIYLTVKTAILAGKPIPSFVYSYHQSHSYYMTCAYGIPAIQVDNDDNIWRFPDYLITDTIIRPSQEYKILSIHINSIYNLGTTVSLRRQYMRTNEAFNCLNVFSFLEFQTMKKYRSTMTTMDEDELQFIYDVFGGCGLLLLSRGSNSFSANKYSLVDGALHHFFDDMDPPVHQFLDSWDSCVHLICHCLDGSVESMFDLVLHKIGNHRGEWDTYWASPFMKSFAGTFLNNNDEIFYYNTLHAVFGSDSPDIIFERNAHDMIFKNLKAGKSYYLESLEDYTSTAVVSVAVAAKKKKKKKKVFLKMPITKTRLLRTIEDVNAIRCNEYGVPVPSIFPPIHAVVHGAIFQMTTSKTHWESKAMLANVIREMSSGNTSSTANLKMIFVLKNDQNYQDFKYVPGLGDIKQYKMIP